MQVTIHATPGARRDCVGGAHDGALRVSVSAPPDKGRANDAITKTLAKALGVRVAQIELIRGQTSRRKVFTIHDPPENLQQRIDELLAKS